MAFTPVENPDLRTYDILPDGGLGITAYYPLGNRTLKQCALIPGQTLPRDSTAGIVGGAIQISDSVRYGVVKAHQAEYLYATAQDRTGTVTGAYGATTVVTATTPIFYPGLVGESVVIADTGTFTVASYTSPTVIVITADATCSAKTITLTEGSRLLSESVSDAYRWNRKGRWRCVRRYHCLTANRDAEARVLGATKYTFAADEYSVQGGVSDLISKGRDPRYPHQAVIEVTYEAPFNPHDFPLTYATLEMQTSKDAFRKTKEPAGNGGKDIETRPDAIGYYYTVVAGTNQIPNGNPVYVIRSAMEKSDLTGAGYETLAAMKGTVNSDACVNIGNAGIGELRCLEVKTAPHFIRHNDTEIVPVMWVLEFLDGGWADGCTSQKRRRFPKAQPVLHPDDDPTAADRYYLEKDGGKSAPNVDANAKTRIVMVDVPANMAGDDGTRDCYAKAAWSTVNGLLSWVS